MKIQSSCEIELKKKKKVGRGRGEGGVQAVQVYFFVITRFDTSSLRQISRSRNYNNFLYRLPPLVVCFLASSTPSGLPRREVRVQYYRASTAAFVQFDTTKTSALSTNSQLRRRSNNFIKYQKDTGNLVLGDSSSLD